MRFIILAVLSAIQISRCCMAQTSAGGASQPPVPGTISSSVPAPDFDELRDGAADIRAAIQQAKQTHQRIILYVGGDWCPYCEQLHELFRRNPDLLGLRDHGFITVPIAYGYGRKAAAEVLAPYSKVLGIPHFFVLDSDGTLLHSQHMVELRQSGGYDPAKMRDFLNRWSAPEQRATASLQSR